jgi:hypothetical protein
MKKIIYCFAVLSLLLALVACGSSTTQFTGTGSSDSLPAATELLVGTFKLEGTDLAVTSDQSKQLLPLWQMYESLSTSSTAATEEINALVEQIKTTMTADQMDDIASMGLTQQDVMTLMGQNGGFGGNSLDAASTPMAFNDMPGGYVGSGRDMPAGGLPSGGMPGGAPPSGGFSGGDPVMTGGSGMSSTPQAVRSLGMTDHVPAPLLKSLIELLQERSQS